MSPEIALMIAPDRTYAALVARPDRIGIVRAVRRPLLVVVVLGTSMALSATRHVTPSLVLSTSAVLSGIVMLQIVFALAMTSGARLPAIGRARALDLFFASHAPWSFFMLMSAAWVPSPFGRHAGPLWLALVPMALTPRIIAAYFREVHGLDRRQAAVRTMLHQAVTWGSALALFGAAVALWPRVLQALS